MWCGMCGRAWRGQGSVVFGGMQWRAVRYGVAESTMAAGTRPMSDRIRIKPIHFEAAALLLLAGCYPGCAACCAAAGHK